VPSKKFSQIGQWQECFTIWREEKEEEEKEEEEKRGGGRWKRRTRRGDEPEV
jgi:hypothetical protein